MKLRNTAAAVLAALTAASASICAYAEENKVELAALNRADVHGMTNLANLGGGYGLCLSNNNFVCGMVHLEKNDKGELTYTDVETDLDFSKNLVAWSGSSKYFQIAEKDAEGNVTKRYVMNLDKANNKAATVYNPSTDWGYTTDDGYTVSASDNTVTLYKPDGSTVKHDIDAYSCKVVGSDKYIAYFSERYNETTDEDGFPLADCRVYGMDRDGNLKELFGAEQIVHGINIVAGSESHVLLRVDNVMVRYFLVDLNTGMPSDALSLGDLNFIGTYNGLIATELGIYDPQAKEYLNTTDVTIVGTADNGKTYLVKNADGKYGYLDANGKQIGDWYDTADGFIGDYAPVVKDGKAYLIDRNFNRVSDTVDGTVVASFDDDIFGIQMSDGISFVTYNTSTAAPVDTSKPADTSDPSDTSEPVESVSSEPSDDHDKENPKTGVTVAAVAVGLAALAGAVVVVNRKKK